LQTSGLINCTLESSWPCLSQTADYKNATVIDEKSGTFLWLTVYRVPAVERYFIAFNITNSILT